MPTVWRLQTTPGGNSIAQYCLENKVAALGWSVKDCPGVENLDHLTIEQYRELAAKVYGKYREYSSVIRMATEVREDDIIWMRGQGIYYMARVEGESHWFYNSDPTLEIDASNQLTDIKWEVVGDESEVPEALATTFNRGTTFQRINSPEVLEFSERTYNQKHPGGFHYGIPEES